ncbi:MAG: uracil-DNA glycosylase [Hyphomicrobiales bacterium]
MPEEHFLKEAPYDCARCERLHGFLAEQRAAHPDWFNGPVESFGNDDAKLLIVGLAPGLRGANKTGRPFTGDWAGDLLYGTLDKFGFSKGTFAARPDDGLELISCMITNAVRCVPPQNKPVAAEIKNCNGYLTARIAALPRLQAILTLGRIAHEATLTALGERKSARKFGHGARHNVGAIQIFNSYHCSRYNTNTGRLTTEMFEAVFADLRKSL